MKSCFLYLKAFSSLLANETRMMEFILLTRKSFFFLCHIYTLALAIELTRIFQIFVNISDWQIVSLIKN